MANRQVVYAYRHIRPPALESGVIWVLLDAVPRLDVDLAGRRSGALVEAEPPQERGLLPFRSKLRLLRRAAHEGHI